MLGHEIGLNSSWPHRTGSLFLEAVQPSGYHRPVAFGNLRNLVDFLAQ